VTSFKDKMKGLEETKKRLDEILESEEVKSFSEEKKVILFFHIVKKFPESLFLDEIVKNNKGGNDEV
jgi:hypothetical protein